MMPDPDDYDTHGHDQDDDDMPHPLTEGNADDEVNPRALFQPSNLASNIRAPTNGLHANPYFSFVAPPASGGARPR